MAANSVILFCVAGLIKEKMRKLTKTYERIGLYISRLMIHRGDRQIKHLKLKEHQMLVFANEDVGRQLNLYGKYEAEETSFFSKNIRAEDICFDVGGNVGYFALLFAKLASQGAVHVFEPIRLNASIIDVNAVLNGYKNIKINLTAVGDTSGTVSFTISKDSAYSSIYDTNRVPAAQVMVTPITTLDSYIEENIISRVDIIKIDVEGAEEIVLKGADKLFSNINSRPRIVLLELYDVNLTPFGTTSEKIVKRMEDLGYQTKVIAGEKGNLIPYSPKKHKNIYNIIFTAKKD